MGSDDLQNYSLGPTLRTYGPNIKVTAILGVVGVFPCLLAFAVAIEVRDPIAWAIFYALFALYGGMFLRQLSSRVWLHETGISYRGILGHGEMRWLDLDRIYFGAYEVHAHYIPLGTFYRLGLVSRQGQKVSLGERVRHADELAQEIRKLTFKQLMEKATQIFENGQEVDFGGILVSRTEGLTVRRWLSDKNIPWPEIEGYEATDAYFKIHQFKKRFSVNVSSQKIANVHVLRALMGGVMHHVWQGQTPLARGRTGT
jgi:uncharacterized protein DUF6585